MRNLSLLGTTSYIQSVGQGESISALAFDLDENAQYIATELVSEDGDVNVKLWKTDGDDSSSLGQVSYFAYLIAFRGKCRMDFPHPNTNSMQ